MSPRHRHRIRFRCLPACAPLESRELLSASPGDLPSSLPSTATATDPEREPAALLVRFADNGPSASLSALAEWGATIADYQPGRPARVVLDDLASSASASAIAEALSRFPDIIYAELDQALEAAATFNDPSYRVQWGLNNGNNADIDAPEGLDLANASGSGSGAGANVIVAVIDSGIDASHPDLRSQLWTNPGEIPNNGIDDDRNNYIDDVQGWNFVAETNRPYDDFGHGTHVSGIIAAAADNGIGIVGVNPNARIMPLKFLNASGGGDISDAVRAIYYAVDNGAGVINASWTGGGYSRSLEEALRHANSRGVVFVAAAGNEGTNNDRIASYPSSYKVANVLTVTAIDSAGRLPSYANYGRQTVAVGAPGSNIISLWPGGGTHYLSGTSMAAPFVSGIVSLLYSYPSTSALSASQKVSRIIASAKPFSSLSTKTRSGGIADADNALAGRSQISTRAQTTPTTPRARNNRVRGRALGAAATEARADSSTAIALQRQLAILTSDPDVFAPKRAGNARGVRGR